MNDTRGAMQQCLQGCDLVDFATCALAQQPESTIRVPADLQVSCLGLGSCVQVHMQPSRGCAVCIPLVQRPVLHHTVKRTLFPRKQAAPKIHVCHPGHLQDVPMHTPGCIYTPRGALRHPQGFTSGCTNAAKGYTFCMTGCCPVMPDQRTKGQVGSHGPPCLTCFCLGSIYNTGSSCQCHQ